MRLLIVEDEKNVAAFIKKGLEEEFYTVDTAGTGTTGLDLASTNNYDLIILDVMLPEMSGLEVCKNIRTMRIKTPVLLLTAMDSVSDKVKGLGCGADDYLTKPFSFEELLARIKALLRRSADYAGELFFEDLRMDLLAKRVYRDNQEIVLTPKEFALLEYLLRNKGRALSRTQIIENVWGYNFDPLTNVVDVHIKFLREKVDIPFPKKLIHTVRGVGYALRTEDDN